jgi:hypothetical protein
MLRGLTVFVPDQIWLAEYPIRYAGAAFNARMTVIRLSGDRLLIHSPCAMDQPLQRAISALGRVAFILAPGNFHYFHVASCQQAFPEASTWICPGVERKRPDLRHDGLLGDRPEPGWAEELDQVQVAGARLMREVAMFHRPSRTLVLVDLIENFSDQTPGTNWLLKAYFRLLGMWGRPRPAPEYRFGWGDRSAVAASLERILDWDFERIIIAHGDLIEHDARRMAREAWRGVLGNVT